MNWGSFFKLYVYSIILFYGSPVQYVIKLVLKLWNCIKDKDIQVYQTLYIYITHYIHIKKQGLLQERNFLSINRLLFTSEYINRYFQFVSYFHVHSIWFLSESGYNVLRYHKFIGTEQTFYHTFYLTNL